jgi:hypothetical protein
MTPVSQLRRCFLEAEHDNHPAQALINAASDEELSGVVKQVIVAIPTEFKLYENFEWVAIHEGQLPEFRKLDAIEEFGAIRSIYAAKQAHNPNARSLLAAVRNKVIRELIQRVIASNQFAEHMGFGSLQPK